jgi:hypothetical protein
MAVGRSPEENSSSTRCQLLLVGGSPAFDLYISQPLVKMGWPAINIVSFDYCSEVLRSSERINALLPIVLVAESSAWSEDTENWTELEVREIVYLKQYLENMFGCRVYTIALLVRGASALVGVASKYVEELDCAVQVPLNGEELFFAIIRGAQCLELICKASCAYSGSQTHTGFQ